MPINTKIAINNLQTIFRPLDKSYTYTKFKKHKNHKTSKQPSFRLSSNQDLKKAAENIEEDLLWLPNYEIISNNQNEIFTDITRKKSYGDLCNWIVKDVLPVWTKQKRGLNPTELSKGFHKIYMLLNEYYGNKNLDLIYYDCYTLYLDLCRGVYKIL